MEAPWRSLVKTVCYRVLSVFVTAGVAWLVLGDMSIAAKIGIADTGVKLATYYMHERVWNVLPLGKLLGPEYHI